MKSLAITPDDLSARDFEIIRLHIDDGYSRNEIAGKLHYAPKSIRHFFEQSHEGCVYQKIEGVTNMHELREWWTAHRHFKDMIYAVSPADIRELDYARRLGRATIVADQLHREIQLMEQAARRASNDRLARYFLKRCAELLFVYGFALDDTHLQHDGVEQMRRVVVQMRHIAEQIKDRQIQALSHILHSFLSYLQKNYAEEQRHAFQAIAVDAKLDPDILFIAVGHSIIGSGFLGQAEGIQAGEKALKHLLIEAPMLHDIRAVEIPMVSGRAWSLMGDSSGIDSLLQGWEVYDQTDAATNHPREVVSLAKATLEVAPKVGITDKSFLEHRGVQGLEVAQSCGMPRMVNGINNLLNSVLN